MIPPRAQWAWAVEQVRAVGEHAQSLGLEIAIEMEPFHLSIVNSLEKMGRLLADVDCPAVKANLDVSHLALDGMLSIELEYSPEPSRIVEWVTEAYTATDALMRQAGIVRPKAAAQTA